MIGCESAENLADHWQLQCHKLFFFVEHKQMKHGLEQKNKDKIGIFERFFKRTKMFAVVTDPTYDWRMWPKSNKKDLDGLDEFRGCHQEGNLGVL